MSKGISKHSFELWWDKTKQKIKWYCRGKRIRRPHTCWSPPTRCSIEVAPEGKKTPFQYPAAFGSALAISDQTESCTQRFDSPLTTPPPLPPGTRRRRRNLQRKFWPVETCGINQCSTVGCLGTRQCCWKNNSVCTCVDVGLI